MNTEKFLWDTVENYKFLFKRIPFLSAVFVCNSLSFSNSKPNSDIDLFIVAEKNRLFIMRLFITFYLHLFGIRRHGKFISNRFCLSFFIDETHLSLKIIAKKDDFYLAYWIKKLVLVYSNGLTQDFLIKANPWIFNYISKKINPINFSTIYGKSLFRKFFENLPEIFLNFIESTLKFIQKKKALNTYKTVDKERSSIIISDNILKFHNNDKRNFLNTAFISKFPGQKIEKDRDFLSIFP